MIRVPPYSLILIKTIKCTLMLSLAFLMAIITGCGTPSARSQNKPVFFSKTDVRRYAYLGLGQIKAGHYQTARTYFSKGLRENPNNCELNFFNGLSYQLEGQNGSIQLLDLAKVGYRNAIRVCPNDPWPYYYSGVLAVQQNKLIEAEKMFSTANVVTGNSTTLFLKAYLYAAYNVGDIKGVKDVLIQLQKADPNSQLVKELSSTFQYIRTPKSRTAAVNQKKKKTRRRITRTSALKMYHLPKPRMATKKQVIPPPLAESSDPEPTQTAAPASNSALAMNQNNSMQQQPPISSPSPTGNGAATTPSPVQVNNNVGQPLSSSIPGAVPQSLIGGSTPPSTPSTGMPMQNAAPTSFGSSNGQTPGAMPTMQGPPAFPSPQTSSFPPGPSGMPGAFGMPTQKVDHRQLIIDGVIILSRETISSQQGVNLLQGLQLQYGTGTTPGLVYSTNSVQTQGYPSLAVPPTASSAYTLPTLPFTASTTSIISVPAVTYDMNIFNDAGEKSEVLARPSVLVENGHSATYFSGKDLILGIQGSQTGTITEFPLGVTMQLTPLFQKNGSIDLTVQIGREFLIKTDNTTTFSQVAQALKESTATSVNLHYGQTIMLSTLYDSKLETTKNETPFLSKIPIIGLFFGKKTKSNTITNLIMLLTPRKYVRFRTEEFSQWTLQELENFYTTYLKDKKHLGHVIQKLGQLELYGIRSPVKTALSDKEVYTATAREMQMMSEGV